MLTPEQMAKLPYQETPATASDVVAELTELVVLVAGIMSTGGQDGPAMIRDATAEPGRSVVMKQTRVALALDSWQSEAGRFVVEAVVGSLAPDA